MIAESKIGVPKEAVAAFCQRHHIRKLAFFGSVLREDLSPSSVLEFWWSLSRGTFPGLSSSPWKTN